jgi:PIN domain nuclease of toxin-antitoxin system
VVREAERRNEIVALSAVSLLEMAVLCDKRRGPNEAPFGELLGELESNPLLQIVPITMDIALEMAAIGPSLRDPGDRAIVATARVRSLRLLTSDQRIIQSNLVPVIV